MNFKEISGTNHFLRHDDFRIQDKIEVISDLGVDMPVKLQNIMWYLNSSQKDIEVKQC